jgi:hypothetical protein
VAQCSARAAAPPDLLRDKVRVAVRVHQNTDVSEQLAQALARMLRAALHGAELAAAVDAARTDAPHAVKDALDLAARGAIASAVPDAAGPGHDKQKNVLVRRRQGGLSSAPYAASYRRILLRGASHAS